MGGRDEGTYIAQVRLGRWSAVSIMISEDVDLKSLVGCQQSLARSQKSVISRQQSTFQRVKLAVSNQKSVGRNQQRASSCRSSAVRNQQSEISSQKSAISSLQTARKGLQQHFNLLLCKVLERYVYRPTTSVTGTDRVSHLYVPSARGRCPCHLTVGS